jgi:uncharacterized protein
MAEAPRKRCTVVYALPQRQYVWSVELPMQATIADAIVSARAQAGAADVPWDDADVGIFGEIRDRSAVPRDADRIELYRPLACDPREARRERVRHARGSKSSGG